MKTSAILRRPALADHPPLADAIEGIGRAMLALDAGLLAAFRESRRIRRDYRRLMDADDSLLRDIGVTRADIARASARRRGLR
ncbi:DUF1127 domain-containing protein [Skermanella mucosa]|uniref:DUF1127 domain-containing protein n=1 Tax=Skermanella mucosa TaxID=1789672 RepID=UPI00192A834F|nr:DUF1127 domain-containing protein [Skermanella mucosa]UEM21588.1 DUF1127 domain-containing protein [Skermanella mucosa]